MIWFFNIKLQYAYFQFLKTSLKLVFSHMMEQNDARCKREKCCRVLMVSLALSPIAIHYMEKQLHQDLQFILLHLVIGCDYLN